MQHKIFPSKILLFGEHSLLYGGEGLAMPGYDYCGQWVQGPSQQHGTDLFAFAAHLKEYEDKFYRQLEAEAFLNDIDEGWTFQSNIPVGYGAGSSGAFTAAVYDRYAKGDENNLMHIKTDLGIIESFFHGKSSGLDPLVSYCNSAFHLHMGQPDAVILDKSTTDKFRLIDTGIPRLGSAYIKLFKAKMEDRQFTSKIENTLKPAVSKAIAALINDDQKTLTEAYFEISYFQLVWMPEFIPLSWIKTWENKLSDNSGYLKLCGAGGGGFILQYSPEDFT